MFLPLTLQNGIRGCSWQSADSMSMSAQTIGPPMRLLARAGGRTGDPG